MKRLVLASSAVVAVLAGGLVGGVLWYRAAVQAQGPLQDARSIVVPRGSTAQLAAGLAEQGLIDRPLLFRAAVRVSRGDGLLRSAEFAFPAHASVNQVLAILRAGKPVEHRLTIAEGLTAQQIQAVLAAAPAMTGAVPPIEEGSVLPQTYDYEYGAERAAIVARARAAMARDLADAWANRAGGLPLESPTQALILASIVERETARPAERPHVAAVYLNRLRQGMKLQADPTVAYAASGRSGVLDHGLTKAELARDDPFNTYRNIGLPPAPICAPGLESLRAVLHPLDSDDLYFVADGSGGHTFSRGLEAHEAAVTRWRALVPNAPHGSPD
jgi:UPF0755 protein